MSAPTPVVPGTTASSAPGRPDPTVRVCAHGPTLVRGAVSVEHDGTTHPVEHPVVAVCRCAKSSSLPWCDSTHRAIPDY